MVLWLCSARALSVFASTCRCAMKIVEQDTCLADTVLRKPLGGSCRSCPWGGDAKRGSHQLIARKGKGEVLSVFFFNYFFPSGNCKRISLFLPFSLWRFIRCQTSTATPFFVACSKRGPRQSKNTYLVWFATPLEGHPCPQVL